MSKVKITAEQEARIKKERESSDDVTVINHHINNGWSDVNNLCLNKLSDIDFIDALRIGYEVETEFKVGDWVYLKESTLKTFTHLTRCAYEVTDVGDTLICLEGYEDLEMKLHEIRHATPEEIKAEKERQLWKLIGREVGEFKKHDVIIKNSGTSIRISMLDDIQNQYNRGDLELKGFYPEESFISFESVDSNDG